MLLEERLPRRKAFSGMSITEVPKNADVILERMKGSGVSDYDLKVTQMLLREEPWIFAKAEEEEDLLKVSVMVSSIARRHDVHPISMNELFEDILIGTGTIPEDRRFGLTYDVNDVDDDVKPILERAKAGDADAQYEMGMRYRCGKGAFEDEGESYRWMLASAEQDYVDAMYEMGVSFDLGIGTRIDGEIADEWYRKAADLGHVKARERLSG